MFGWRARRKPLLLAASFLLFSVLTWIAWLNSFPTKSEPRDQVPEISLIHNSAEILVRGFYRSSEDYGTWLIVRKNGVENVDGSELGEGILLATPNLAAAIERCEYPENGGTLEKTEKAFGLQELDQWDTYLQPDPYVAFKVNTGTKCLLPEDQNLWDQSGGQFTHWTPHLITETAYTGPAIKSGSTKRTPPLCQTRELIVGTPVERIAQYPKATPKPSPDRYEEVLDDNGTVDPMGSGGETPPDLIGEVDGWQECESTSRLYGGEPPSSTIKDLTVESSANRWLFAGSALSGLAGALLLELGLSVSDKLEVEKRAASTPESSKRKRQARTRRSQ